MYKNILCMLLMTLITVGGLAQESAKPKKTSNHAAHKLPAWAAAHNYKGNAHVYFPDYYSFYDPQRGGYVYWNNNKWIFTPTMPPYMSSIDMKKTRIRILKGLSLDLHPETNYPHYMKLYPAMPGNDKVPVPTGGPTLGQ